MEYSHDYGWPLPVVTSLHPVMPSVELSKMLKNLLRPASCHWHTNLDCRSPYISTWSHTRMTLGPLDGHPEVEVDTLDQSRRGIVKR